MHISIVTPVYNAENILPELYDRLVVSLSKITEDFEIIMVNDGSPGNDWEVIKALNAQDPRVMGVNLSRNFGQHYAISAGLDCCSGDWVVVMDCDLQDQPEEIAKLYNKAMQGYDIVLARRAVRKDSFFKKFLSRMFYRVFSYLTETKQDPAVANFGIYSRDVIESVRKMQDYVRFFPVLVQWVGYKKTYEDVEHASRKSGKSNYNIIKLLKMAFDMIISFSERPLRIGMMSGILISILSFIYALYYLVLYFTGQILVPGFTSLIISIAFSTGLLISFIGLVGIYIGKINTQIKNRPRYIIKDKI